MVEYILPIALIGIMVFTAVSLHKQGFQNALPGLSGGDKTLQDRSALALRPMGSMPYTQPVQITMEDGSILTLNEMPTDIPKLLETMGSDGTTELLIANLRNLAQQLLETKQITQAQYNRLESLANQGHRIAALEAQIEAAARRARNGEEFNNTTFLFDGETMTTRDALSKIMQAGNGVGVSQVGNNPLALEINGIPPGAEKLAFLQLYHQAASGSVLDNPAVKNVVTSLVSQISQLTEQVTQTSYNLGSDRISPNGFKHDLASQATRVNAVGICMAGGTQDSGIYCPRS